MDDATPGDVTERERVGPLQDVRAVRADAEDETLSTLDERVETLLELFGKAHTLSILRQFAVDGGPFRFSELEERIDASPHTLSTRLSELTAAGLLERHAYDEVPPRVEYTWTQSARDLSPAFRHVYDWALENDPATNESAS